jgi:hypothetical protein
MMAQAEIALVGNPSTTEEWGIERRSGLAYAAFVKEYVEPRRPVVLTDLAQGWPALERWTPEYFGERFGERKVDLSLGIKTYRASFRWFAEYLQKHRFSLRREGAPPLLYLRNVPIFRLLPELVEDFSVPALFLPDWFELWPVRRLFPLADGASPLLFIGTSSVPFPIVHRDTLATHTWLTQVYGLKRLWAVPPSQSHLIYQSPKDANHSLVNSLENPDLERFPLMREATVSSVVLRPGETLFLPAGWWHTAACLTTSIGISANFINRTNFEDFLQELRAESPGGLTRKQAWTLRLLRVVGAVFGALFMHRLPLGGTSGSVYQWLRRRSLAARAAGVSR